MLSIRGFLLLGRTVLAHAIRQKDSISFVLRLWLESAGGDAPEWRWQVHHVQSGEQRYFRSLTNMLEFVAACAGVEPPQISKRIAWREEEE